jgi:AcrR family transcriptional regulator
MSASLSSDSRRARKRQQTTDHLVEVAFELFSVHGYDQVTMEQIATTADVAKGTLYNYFPVKEAILAHLFHSELAESIHGFSAEYENLLGSKAYLRAFLHRLAASIERYREYMAPYLRYRLSRAVDTVSKAKLSSIDQTSIKLLTEGLKAGEIRSDLPLDQLVDTLRFMHLSTILRWLHTPESSLAQEFDTMLDLFLNGASSGRGSA